MNMSHEDQRRCEARSHAVTIVRDRWGIPHIRGRTDADAIFGLMYAQAEDDFNRIERNYLCALGRLAEMEGDSAVYKDLRVRLFVTPADLKERYAKSPAWLKEVMDAWADGLNYYLGVHPEVTPRVIKHFEPWMALSFVEGGILGDIARVCVEELQAFYGEHDATCEQPASASIEEISGSNAFAIAPSNTLNGRALLLINPHPDLYFRSEVHVHSEQGLNCYGAATWGQFFVFHGFNEHLGWGHTTSGADTVDEYLETVTERDGGFFYRFGDMERPVRASKITIAFRTVLGALENRSFNAYWTHRGPVVRKVDGTWVSIALMYKPVEALSQAFLRMKARSYQEFVNIAGLKANSVANAVYADADGNIAYFHPQFIPRRDDQFDFTQPVNGADPATEWKGEHALDELPHVYNPPCGWIANTNDSPYSVAGPCSPNASDFPRYMDTAGSNPRGVNAALLLNGRTDFTLSSLIQAAYDPYLHAFARLIPGLLSAHDQLPASNAMKEKLAEQIAVLRGWDHRHSVDSIATSLAVLWGNQMLRDFEPIARNISVELASMFDYLLKARISATLTFRALNSIYDHLVDDRLAPMKLAALMKVSDQLVQDFGTWRTPWGEINRFQRLSGDIEQAFDDQQPSKPVSLVSNIWGALASFKAHRYENTKRYYGTSGNSFVAAVEFGERVQALAITAGGASGDPRSPHFNDQSTRFATGDLREVYFYPDHLENHTERMYRPGR